MRFIHDELGENSIFSIWMSIGVLLISFGNFNGNVSGPISELMKFLTTMQPSCSHL